MFTPRRSSTSADPLPVLETFPCLATLAPQEAETIPAAVDTLNVFGAPPVPQVSRRVSGESNATPVTHSLITLVAPKSSAPVGILTASVTKKLFICSSEASPHIMIRKESDIIDADNVSPSRNLEMA